VYYEEASGSSSSSEEGWSIAVNGELLEEEATASEVGRSAMVAVSSSLKQVLEDEGIEAVLLVWSGGTKTWWRWSAMVNSASGGRGVSAGERARGGSEMVEDSSTGRTRREDKAFNPCGAVVTGGDRCRRPLCSERGHHTVTGCMAGGSRTGDRFPWSKAFGPRPVGRPAKEMFFHYSNSA
jgi:hypothetical protein